MQKEYNSLKIKFKPKKPKFYSHKKTVLQICKKIHQNVHLTIQFFVCVFFKRFVFLLINLNIFFSSHFNSIKNIP